MNVDDFEDRVCTKAGQNHVDILKQRLEFLEIQYKQTVVVLNESLGLHRDRPDETSHSKQNRIAALIN
jgi:hypothetical protein